MSLLLLVLGAVALLFSANALWPRYRPSTLAGLSFFAGWLGSELAAHFIVIDVLLTLFLVWHGALAAWPGWLGLALIALACTLRLAALSDSRASVGAVTAALSDLPAAGARSGEWQKLLLPLWGRDSRVARTRNVVFFEAGALKLKVDVFAARGASGQAKRPVFLYVHGGAWVLGNKKYQGLPTLHRLAARGWVGFSVDYRLSPRATFPDHIIDVKRAIAWVRAHAEEYGADPDCIVIGGGSAGGHLAALAALTPGKRDWQPAFEDADTSVAACVSFYGIFDLTDRNRHWHHSGMRRLLERMVFKAKVVDARARFEEASPIHWIKAGSATPPFLVIQGVNDTLVPVAEARAFVAALRAAGGQCAYIELPGAQHAFEIFPSWRTLSVVDGVERFVESVRRQASART